MKANVMLIDDNKIDLFISEKIIKKLCIDSNIRTFSSAKSGIEFLKLLEENTFSKTMLVPDIILLDINMPEMDGFQFLNEFNKLTKMKEKNIKIYMLSSSSNLKDINKAKNNKVCSGFINKPLTVQSLNRALVCCKPYLSEYDFMEGDINLELVRRI